jgi:hypothetical protein
MHTLTLTPRQLQELKFAVEQQIDHEGLGPKWVVDLLKLIWSAEGQGE